MNHFKAVDVNGGGFVLYGEWSKYIRAQEVKTKTHLGTLLSGNRKPKTIAGGRKNSKGSNLSTRKVTTFLKYLHA